MGWLRIAYYRVFRYYFASPHLPRPSEFSQCLKILHKYLNILREIDLFFSFRLRVKSRSFVGNMVGTLTVIVPEDILMEDVEALIICWHEKHYSATKMYTKLLARACPAYSTTTNWIGALTRGEDIYDYASGGGHLPDDRVDTLVINALEESPFHSVRSLASTIKIPPTTVWRHLHARGYVVRNLYIVPHMLPLAQKQPESNQ
jgi:hypothetical protein